VTGKICYQFAECGDAVATNLHCKTGGGARATGIMSGALVPQKKAPEFSGAFSQP